MANVSFSINKPPETTPPPEVNIWLELCEDGTVEVRATHNSSNATLFVIGSNGYYPMTSIPMGVREVLCTELADRFKRLQARSDVKV